MRDRNHKDYTPHLDRTLRKCLGHGCGEAFLSYGPHNRICDNCKLTPYWADMIANLTEHQVSDIRAKVGKS